MTAHSKFLSTMAKGLLVSVAMAVLGLTWGCGEVPSQAPMDDAAKARVQEAHNREKQFMEKVARKAKASGRKGARLSEADLRPEPPGGP
jgi:hypothetical protein